MKTVVIAAIASMVVGFVWYGPLFGKTWMKLTGMKEMGNKSDMPKTYGITFVGSLVTAYVLSVFLGLTNSGTLTSALTLAVWVWLGFVATVALSGPLFDKKPWNLYFLNVSYQLANFLVMAAVLSYIK